MGASQTNQGRLIDVVEWNRWRLTAAGSTPDLAEADFLGVELRDANLADCDLGGARFMETGVDRADFSRAVLDHAVFVRVDLRQARGLETVRCDDWISFDGWTLAWSRGALSERLLLRAGLRGEWLRHFAAAPTYYSCFISYKSEDRWFAERLKERLESRGVPVWFAPEELKSGDRITPALLEAAGQNQRLIVVLSRQALSSPRWVATEVHAALEGEYGGDQRVFPVAVDGAYLEESYGHQKWLAALRDGRHVLDFSGWERGGAMDEGVEKLIEKLTIPTRNTVRVSAPHPATPEC